MGNTNTSAITLVKCTIFAVNQLLSFALAIIDNRAREGETLQGIVQTLVFEFVATSEYSNKQNLPFQLRTKP